MARRAFDQYDTPPWQVDALVDYVPALCSPLWEPCAGDGSLLSRLLERRPDLDEILTIDVDQTKGAMLAHDMAEPDAWQALSQEFGPPAWVVTNPPFAHQFPILQLALEYATIGVAFLSRVSFAEPTTSRGPWLKLHPHDQRIVLERYSYTENRRSDVCTTEWLIYAKDWKILTPPFGISAWGYKPRRKSQRQA